MAFRIPFAVNNCRTRSHSRSRKMKRTKSGVIAKETAAATAAGLGVRCHSMFRTASHQAEKLRRHSCPVREPCEKLIKATRNDSVYVCASVRCRMCARCPLRMQCTMLRYRHFVDFIVCYGPLSFRRACPANFSSLSRVCLSSCSRVPPVPNQFEVIVSSNMLCSTVRRREKTRQSFVTNCCH